MMTLFSKYLQCNKWLMCNIKKQGFSLVETLVAISVLMLAVVGPLSIASRGLISAQFSRDQITAFHLAREAVELVRNKRDSNTLSPTAIPDDWLNGMELCRMQSVCKVDPLTETFSSCVLGVCPPLLKSDTGVYGYNFGWAETGFTRNITIEEIVPGEETAVHVSLLWHTGILSKEFTITEHFFNWKQ